MNQKIDWDNKNEVKKYHKEYDENYLQRQEIKKKRKEQRKHKRKQYQEYRKKYAKKYPEKANEQKRNVKLKKDLIEERKKCEICGSTEHLQVHHKKYINIINLKHLMLLCRKCHNAYHNGKIKIIERRFKK